MSYEFIGIYQGKDIYLPSDQYDEVKALIRFQQDELERLKAELTIEGTMQRIKDKADE